MSIYAIGDIQGCYTPLRRLLDKVGFDPAKDTLWGVGDLVNRGPESLETLRFLKSLGSSFNSVLGNHDLHLLAIASTDKGPRKKDTLLEILEAEDSADLLDWLRNFPLAAYLDEEKTLIVHAGLPPFWSVRQACVYAKEVENVIQGENYPAFFAKMYGNDPDHWYDQLEGFDRLRTITNLLTRMRYFYEDYRLELDTKCGPEQAPAKLKPWFTFPNQLQAGQHVVFGHWATLLGKCPVPNIHAIDSGCVWGNALSLIELGSWSRTLFR